MNDPDASNASVFIDGSAGSTGLRVRELLGGRSDLTLVTLPDAVRKDAGARAEALNAADVAILCLPDAAAAEAIELLEPGSDTRIIDASSARRTSPDWVYGLPELSAAQRDKVCSAKRLANPGCYPQTFILGMRPLVDAGVLPADGGYTCNAVSGYSGGGRALVDRYEAAAADGQHLPLGLYGLAGGHKHIPEIVAFAGVTRAPLFVPSVEHAFAGMLVSVPLPGTLTGNLGAAEVYHLWRERYAGCPFVTPVDPARTADALDPHGFLPLSADLGNRLELHVVEQRDDAGLLLLGRLDNLAKGASGNAVQCLNLMLGRDETLGLT